jgi:hypothetical protein
MHKTSIHVSLKEIRGETHSNPRNHTGNKGTKTSTKIAQKELRKINKRNSGIERLAQDLEDEITMNILSNRLQATPRNQI